MDTTRLQELQEQERKLRYDTNEAYALRHRVLGCPDLEKRAEKVYSRLKAALCTLQQQISVLEDVRDRLRFEKELQKLEEKHSGETPSVIT